MQRCKILFNLIYGTLCNKNNKEKIFDLLYNLDVQNSIYTDLEEYYKHHLLVEKYNLIDNIIFQYEESNEMVEVEKTEEAEDIE